MIKYLIILLISLFSSTAFAVDVASTFWCQNQTCEASPNWTTGTSNNNAFSWCAWDNSAQGGTVVSGSSGTTSGGIGYQIYNCINASGNLRYSFETHSNDACPAGASGFPCTCTAPNTPTSQNQACNVPPVTCDGAGVKNSSFGKEFTLSGSVGDTLCVGGCSFNVTDSLSSSDGSFVVIGRAAGSTPCTTAPGLTAKHSSPPSPMTPTGCLEQGKSYITMNNVTQCVAQGSSGSASTTSTSNQQTTVSGVPGTSTISQSTSSDGSGSGTVTRTTTTTGSNGVSTTSTTTAPVSQFCETNPQASMCKEKKGSAGGGESCTTPPSCDGDAILCAQLQQTWTARCESQTSSAIRTLGEDVLNGSDPLANKPDPANPTVVPVGSLNTTEIFTGSSCPAPVTANFTLMGHANNLSFDLTPFCTLGGVIGLLNVLASLFAAGRIIAGGI